MEHFLFINFTSSVIRILSKLDLVNLRIVETSEKLVIAWKSNNRMEQKK